MNRIFKFTSAAIIFHFALNSCTTDGIDTEKLDSNNFELNQKLTLNKTTSKISTLFWNMGVVEVIVWDKVNYKVFEFKTIKEFGFNKESINLSNYSILLKDGLISLNSNSDKRLSIVNSKPYLLSSKYSGFIESDKFHDDLETNILLLFMNELITPEESKIDSNKLINYQFKVASCSFWDTYYVFATGTSRAVAEANLVDEISYYSSGFNTLSVEGCSKIGGVDTSCMLDNHFCVASQAYCCD